MRWALALLILGILVGCNSEIQPTPTPNIAATPAANLQTETLASIQEAITPTSTQKPPATPITHTYVVKEGDTCLSIAVSYGISVHSIFLVNDLEVTCSLVKGQELLIREPTSIPSPTITPTFAENVYLEGQAHLSNKLGNPYPDGAYFDLDRGGTGSKLGVDFVFGYSAGSDVFYVMRGLSPGALSFFDSSEPTFQDCLEKKPNLSNGSQPEVFVGSTFCALTDEGRLAKLTVVDFSRMEGSAYLTLDFTVWEPVVEIFGTPLPEPADCLLPPDDYTRIEVNGQTLNQRTLFMLQHAAELYDGRIDVANLAITQGSYTDAVGLSFGTHAGGGAVDISVVARERFEILWDEIPPLLEALRTAGFAAWLREAGELSPTSAVHIHAIAIGDVEASADAEAQLTGEYGYFRGYNGLPPDFGGPALDKWGGPILCNWMRDLGYADLRD